MMSSEPGILAELDASLMLVIGGAKACHLQKVESMFTESPQGPVRK
jgi:hypothetical protein